MCDYSLDLVASRPAKVGDELVTTQFKNSITRGFAAIGEPNVAVCLLPGTEVAFGKGSQVRALFCSFPDHEIRETREESGAVPADQRGQAARASRCAGVPQRGNRTAHPAVRRPARNGAAVAGFAPCERSGGAKARFARGAHYRACLAVCMIEDSHDSGREAILGLSAQFRLWLPAPHTGEIRPRNRSASDTWFSHGQTVLWARRLFARAEEQGTSAKGREGGGIPRT